MVKCNVHPEQDTIGNCVRCGRGICSLCTVNVAGKTYCTDCAKESGGEGAFKEAEVVGEAKGVEWDERPKMGFWSALWQTWKHIIFHPKDFFSKMPTRGGLKGPLFFGAIFVTIQVLINFAYGLLRLTGPEAPQLPPGAFAINVIIWVILSPLIAIVGLFIGSAIWHLIVWIFGGRQGFEATFRVICYSSAVVIFALVPIIGGIFAGIYMLVLYFLGIRQAHKLTTGRALAVVLLPIVIALLGLFLAIGAPNFIAARATVQANLCVNNMRIIDAAIVQWALENEKSIGDEVDEIAVARYIREGKLPTCPIDGASYTINRVGDTPQVVCPSGLESHSLLKEKGFR